MQALDPGRRRGHPPAPAHPDAAEAGHAARRPAVHPLHGRLARPARGRRTSSSPAASGQKPSSGARRRAGAAARDPYVEEPEPLGTAGPLRLAADEGLLDERFLVLNGDILADLDLAALMPRPRRDAAPSPPSRSIRSTTRSAYGLVRTRRRRRRGRRVPREARSRRDRHRRDQRGRIRARARVLDLIPRGPHGLDRARGVSAPGRQWVVRSRRLDGYWMDIGTPERYLAGELGHPRGPRADGGGGPPRGRRSLAAGPT